MSILDAYRKDRSDVWTAADAANFASIVEGVRMADRRWALISGGNVVLENVSMDRISAFLQEVSAECTDFVVQHWMDGKWNNVPNSSQYTADVILKARKDS